jgi:hypothetical protein
LNLQNETELDVFLTEWPINEIKKIKGSSGQVYDVHKRDSFSFIMKSLFEPYPEYRYEYNEIRTHLLFDTWKIEQNSDKIVENTRREHGLCPQCGSEGKWISFALVCDTHGLYV